MNLILDESGEGELGGLRYNVFDIGVLSHRFLYSRGKWVSRVKTVMSKWTPPFPVFVESRGMGVVVETQCVPDKVMFLLLPREGEWVEGKCLISNMGSVPLRHLGHRYG